jgi:hypothetical protein
LGNAPGQELCDAQINHGTQKKRACDFLSSRPQLQIATLAARLREVGLLDNAGARALTSNTEEKFLQAEAVDQEIGTELQRQSPDRTSADAKGDLASGSDDVWSR